MGNLNLTQMATSQTDKETVNNDGNDELDLALTDDLITLVDDSNAATITDATWRRAMLFVLADGAPVPTATVTITCPTILRGIFVVKNEMAFDAIITISAQAVTPSHVAPGAQQAFESDGTNIRPVSLGRGRHPLDITTLREIAANDIDTLANHGGILTSDSTPDLARLNGATDKALRVNWPLADVTEVQFPPVPMYEDIDETQDITIHLLARMGGATDTPTIDVQVFDAIGDTEMGSATAALSATLAELTVTIGAADLSGHPLGFLNIALVPGAHGTDALELFAAWVEYEKKAV